MVLAQTDCKLFFNVFQPYGNWPAPPMPTAFYPPMMWQALEIIQHTPSQSYSVQYAQSSCHYNYSNNFTNMNEMSYESQMSSFASAPGPYALQPPMYNGHYQYMPHYFVNTPQMPLAINPVPAHRPLVIIRPTEPSSVNETYQTVGGRYYEPSSRPQRFIQAKTMLQQHPSMIIRPTEPSSIGGTYQMADAYRQQPRDWSQSYTIPSQHISVQPAQSQNVTPLPLHHSSVIGRPRGLSSVNGAYQTAGACQQHGFDRNYEPMPLAQPQLFMNVPQNQSVQPSTMPTRNFIRSTEHSSANAPYQPMTGLQQQQQQLSLRNVSTVANLPPQPNVATIQHQPQLNSNSTTQGVPLAGPINRHEYADESSTNDEQSSRDSDEENSTDVNNSSSSEDDNDQSDESGDDESDDSDSHNISLFSVHTSFDSDNEIEDKTKINLEIENKTLKYGYVAIGQQQCDSDRECAICLGDFIAGENVRRLRCFHTFHVTCVDKWFYMQHVNCPLCRTIVIRSKV